MKQIGPAHMLVGEPFHLAGEMKLIRWQQRPSTLCRRSGPPPQPRGCRPRRPLPSKSQKDLTQLSVKQRAQQDKKIHHPSPPLPKTHLNTSFNTKHCIIHFLFILNLYLGFLSSTSSPSWPFFFPFSFHGGRHGLFGKIVLASLQFWELHLSLSMTKFWIKVLRLFRLGSGPMVPPNFL